MQVLKQLGSAHGWPPTEALTQIKQVRKPVIVVEVEQIVLGALHSDL